MKCEKCGFEMEHLKINKFDHNGSDYEWYEAINCVDEETGAVVFETDRSWTCYELEEEEMIEGIRCPNCGEFPFEHKEVQVYDIVRVVCFKTDKVV